MVIQVLVLSQSYENIDTQKYGFLFRVNLIYYE